MVMIQMANRTIISIVALILYVGAINYYIAVFGTGQYPHHFVKNLFAYPNFLISFFLAADIWYECNEGWHKQIMVITILCVAVNFFLCTLVNHDIIATDFKPRFFIFNGGVLLVTLCILVSGLKHGLFKK